MKKIIVAVALCIVTAHCLGMETTNVITLESDKVGRIKADYAYKCGQRGVEIIFAMITGIDIPGTDVTVPAGIDLKDIVADALAFESSTAAEKEIKKEDGAKAVSFKDSAEGLLVHNAYYRGMHDRLQSIKFHVADKMGHEYTIGNSNASECIEIDISLAHGLVHKPRFTGSWQSCLSTRGNAISSSLI